MTSGYAELHAHSYFSFLDGVCSPHDMVQEAARLELDALALIDHDGFYGLVQFANAAHEIGMPTIFGAELSLGLTKRQTGIADPQGQHLVVLARDPQGYAQLSRAIATANLAGSKGRPVLSLTDLAQANDGHWAVLTGCRKGTVPAALAADGRAGAHHALDDLVDAFGHDNVFVELWSHSNPIDDERNDVLAHLAEQHKLPTLATTNAHYATPSRHQLASAVAAVRARRDLAEMDGWLPAGPAAHLRSAREQLQRFSCYPGAVQRAGELGRSLAFDLSLIAPQLPDFPVPPGHTEASYLRELATEGAIKRYGTREAERIPGAWKQIDYELDIISELNFPGYFLVVWDIVQFCRRNDILCQGRGSAANSAVCYSLGVTNADPVSLGLLFERFLSPARDGPPDIDIDIESGRREEAIQYVYSRHGREHAAQVANVITYRPRSAVRDAAKALGFAPDEATSWTKHMNFYHRFSPAPTPSELSSGDPRPGQPSPAPADPRDGLMPVDVRDLAMELIDFPRHLGVHSGGMVICDRPVIEVCPVEWATAPGRTVLQWDKDDCATVGLVKFDLLGLGMLEAIHRTIDLIADYHGVTIDLALLPQEDEIYDRLCKADTIGVFQIESRAQMGTLPRLKPRNFYDLVVEVALIRPGPIQGGSVHPYLRRRNGKEAVTYLHPLLERSLKKTLGVPIFQEQLMQMAIDVAGFSPADADRLRQAMGSKRSAARMEAIRGRLYEGMAERGVTGEVADQIFDSLRAFAAFGFPESHAASFAYLVYSSSWLKLHYPAAFLVGLLNSQPMGFWSPATLVADARRHGVTVARPDVNASEAIASLEPMPDSALPAVRLGIDSVRHIGSDTAEQLAAGAPYRDLGDLARRNSLSRKQLEALATAGATHSLDSGDRRGTLWAAGTAAQLRPDQLTNVSTKATAPALPPMSASELLVADLATTGISVDASPADLLGPALKGYEVIKSRDLANTHDGQRVNVAGIVTHRQRPETAAGVTFINLEDETGLINVVCSKGLWVRHRDIADTATALLVRGVIESTEGVVNIVAHKLIDLPLTITTHTRNYC